jgi:hypothetical protein
MDVNLCYYCIYKIMANIEIMYPTVQFNGDHIIVNVINDIYVALYNEPNENDSYVWDNKSTDYSKKLSDAFDYINTTSHEKRDRQLLILQHFRDSFNEISGFDGGTCSLDNYPNYDGDNDSLWKKLKSKYNVNVEREICIMTWGSTFVFEKPSGCQHSFNSATLRGAIKRVNKSERSEQEKLMVKDLRKLRGTHKKIQHEVREAELFEKFMENVVSEIEHNNFQTIGIFCVRGHHRSVACAEMLSKFVYNKSVVKHLNLNM